MTSEDRQTGSIMVLVMVILVALLSAGAVVVGLLVADTRTANVNNSARKAMFYAEAGLEAACPVFTLNRAEWNDVLDGAPFPAWYDVEVGIPDGIPGFEGEIDGTNGALEDYRVTMIDNPEPDGDLTVDTDNRVYLVAESVGTPRYPRTLVMMIETVAAAGCGSDPVGGINRCNDGNTNNAGAVVAACSKY